MQIEPTDIGTAFKGDRYCFVVNSLLPLSRDLPPKQLLMLAESLRSIGRLREAIGVLDIELNKETLFGFDLRFCHAMISFDLGDYTTAEQSFKVICENDPSLPGWYWIARGGNAMRLQEFDDAKGFFLKAEAHTDVDQDELCINLAVTFRAIGEYEISRSYCLQIGSESMYYLQSQQVQKSMIGV